MIPKNEQSTILFSIFGPKIESRIAIGPVVVGNLSTPEPDIPQAGRGRAAHGRAAGQGGAGQNMWFSITSCLIHYKQRSLQLLRGKNKKYLLFYA